MWRRGDIVLTEKMTMTEVDIDTLRDSIGSKITDLDSVEVVSELREEVEYIKGLIHAGAMLKAFDHPDTDQMELTLKARAYDRLISLLPQED